MVGVGLLTYIHVLWSWYHYLAASFVDTDVLSQGGHVDCLLNFFFLALHPFYFIALQNIEAANTFEQCFHANNVFFPVSSITFTSLNEELSSTMNKMVVGLSQYHSPALFSIKY